MRHTTTAWDRTVLLRGVAAGGVGALVIAVVFAVFDLIAGHPFQTPALLGARLLLATAPQPGAETMAILVLAYSAAHTLVFFALGSIAAFLAADLGTWRHAAWGLPMAAALFVAMEIVFLSFALLLDPSLLDEIGLGRVALGNLLAAAAMTPVVLGARTDPETRP